MKYKLICLDIDGTLVNDEKKLIPEVKERLQAASAEGIRIALLSGRMPAGVSNLERELGIPCIKVCNAGTYILFKDQCISAQYLSPDILRNVYKKIAKKDNIPLWIFQDETWLVTGVDDYIRREMEIIGYQPEVVNAEALADKWEKEGKGLSKLLLAEDPKKIQEIARILQGSEWDGFDTACSADTFLEIFPKGVNKGTALCTICDKLGIDPQNTIAFGDQELDIPMIEAAGVGVAMGNAIQELKEKADYITLTNNELGIVHALDDILKE